MNSHFTYRGEYVIAQMRVHKILTIVLIGGTPNI